MQKKVQPAISKLFLMKWPVGSYYIFYSVLVLEQNPILFLPFISYIFLVKLRITIQSINLLNRQHCYYQWQRPVFVCLCGIFTLSVLSLLIQLKIEHLVLL